MVYKTSLGEMYLGDTKIWLSSLMADKYVGEIDLIITSPPYPLQTQKSYGNYNGNHYKEWLVDIIKDSLRLLSDTGSLVIEIGNTWNKNEPTISTLPMEVLLEIKRELNLHLCQEFICHNPARLPSPVGYVNIQRTRVKDSWTRVWWLSKSPNPKANNKNILLPYSSSMKNLLKKGDYNSGRRPSEHIIGKRSFLQDNGGSIAPSALLSSHIEHFESLLSISNTDSKSDKYLELCRENSIQPHPARMQKGLVSFFIDFLTDEGDIVLDVFAGSNTTGLIAEIKNRRWLGVEINEEIATSSWYRFVE